MGVYCRVMHSRSCFTVSGLEFEINLQGQEGLIPRLIMGMTGVVFPWLIMVAVSLQKFPGPFKQD